MAKKEVAKIYAYMMGLIDEAESNALDAYAGTSFERGIRRSYSGKRTHAKRLARAAGLTV